MWVAAICAGDVDGGNLRLRMYGHAFGMFELQLKHAGGTNLYPQIGDLLRRSSVIYGQTDIINDEDP